MIIPQLISSNDLLAWNSLLSVAINGSYLQSMEYANTKKVIDKSFQSVLFKVNGEVLAGAQYFLKDSKGNFIRVAEIQTGILFKETPSEELIDFIINHFFDWAKMNKASYARINLCVPLTVSGEITNLAKPFLKPLHDNGFKNIEEGKHTYWIDLTLSEDQLLQNMHSKTRYNINRAQRSAIEIIRYDIPTDESFNHFWNLYHRLGHEKRFHILSKEQFKQEYNSLLNAGYANLFVAYCEGVAVNAYLASNFGQASFLYGAINPCYKDINDCFSPGHLGHWKIISFLKERKVKIYDMGFCPGPVPIDGHREYNIWQFKYRFGGDHVQYLPTFGKLISPIRGRVFKYLRYRKR